MFFDSHKTFYATHQGQLNIYIYMVHLSLHLMSGITLLTQYYVIIVSYIT